MPALAARRSLAWTCAAVVTGGLVLVGCGGQASGDAAYPAVSLSAAAPEDFPVAKGRTLADLEQLVPEGPVFAPTVSVLDRGVNRVGFALFDTAHKQLGGAEVAIYVARSDGTGLRGPMIARSESLGVAPQFRSRQAATDPDTAKHVYVADVRLPRAGAAVLVAVARLDGRLVRTGARSVDVGPGSGAGEPPVVGSRAPRIHTPTPADVGGDLSAIDTRIPPLRALHDVDLADVLGREPVVLVFATPQLCQSRVCGPVVDVAAEVQARTRGVRFVHMEIYRDNDLNKGFRPQVAAYRLPTEPWTFVIDRAGIIRERFEGALSVGELERAVARIR